MATKTETRKLVHAWIDPEDAERLDDAARAAERSRSAELRVAIREHLAGQRERGGDVTYGFEGTTSKRYGPPAASRMTLACASGGNVA